jgi:hypothetical protein
VRVATVAGESSDTSDTSDAACARDAADTARAEASARAQIRILRHAQARGKAITAAIARRRNTECAAAAGDGSTKSADAAHTAATSDGAAALAAHTAARGASPEADSAVGIQKFVPRPRTASDGDQSE